ncbi:MAG: hypothetical protein HZC48_01005 [Nitrospirae bacterium]|nr:hypothetical protein [Nitrospirota bacterium]
MAEQAEEEHVIRIEGGIMKITDLFRKVETITPADAKKLIEGEKAGEVEILDVREPAEYERGHIPGARLIPLSILPSRIDEIETDKTIMTYCAHGRRSASAASLLKGHGSAKVYSLEGGITAWNGAVAKGELESGIFLIENLKTIDEYIALAWALEDGNVHFYDTAKDLVNDAEGKKLFAELVNAEDNHKSNILKAFRDMKGADISLTYLKDVSSKGIMEGGIHIKEALEWINDNGQDIKNMLELSMQLETNSLDLYFKIMKEAESEDIKSVFRSIIEEEKDHLKHLGNLFEEKI